MKPLPAEKTGVIRVASEVIPSLPAALPSSPGSYSKANRRVGSCTLQSCYPWLLATSTAIAALFCLLYITKPVIVPPATSLGNTPATPPAPPEHPKRQAPQNNLLPGTHSLPGEASSSAAVKPTPADPRRALPSPPTSSAFEETNLRIQHVLTAEAPGGHLDRIDIDVPVLYQSRNLRWNAAETAEARKLLTRLMDHQEKTHQLRSDGVELLDAWNALVSKSIPASDLRADSPSLPDNQEDAADAPRPAGFTTTDSIEIQPAGP